MRILQHVICRTAGATPLLKNDNDCVFCSFRKILAVRPENVVRSFFTVLELHAFSMKKPVLVDYTRKSPQDHVPFFIRHRNGLLLKCLIVISKESNTLQCTPCWNHHKRLSLKKFPNKFNASQCCQLPLYAYTASHKEKGNRYSMIGLPGMIRLSCTLW